MIVVSGGMQKSGSTLLMAYATALITRQHSDAGQKAFEAWIKHGPVGGSGAFPWDGWIARWNELDTLAKEHGPFVLKTHSSFVLLQDALRTRDVKTIYSFRDPRDAVLSAIDHGNRSRANGDWPYVECTDLATTLPTVREWCKAAVTWLDAPSVMLFRYEDMINEPVAQVRRLAIHLGVSDPESAAAKVVEEECATREPGKNQFNKGTAVRWPTEMTAAQLAQCEQMLGEYIRAMGYEVGSKPAEEV